MTALAASPFQSTRPPVTAQPAAAEPAGQPKDADALPGSSSAGTEQAAQQLHLQPPAPVAAAPFVPSWLPNERVMCGAATLAGSRYGSLNQDYQITTQLQDAKTLRAHRWPQCVSTIVLDGHGMLGELAAREAGSAMVRSLKAGRLSSSRLEDLSASEVEGVMRTAFQAGHAAALLVWEDAPVTYSFPKGSSAERRYVLYTHPDGEKVYTSPYLGSRMLEFGTSATVAIVQGTTLAVGSVGDSLAVLGREEGDEYTAETVSVRHSGLEASERERVKSQHGDAVSISDDGYLVVCEGRMAGFQLAMTRALGHRLLADHGVIDTPSVQLYKLQPEHVCLITATDGVWEAITPVGAVKLVCDCLAQGLTAAEAARQLCSESVRLADASGLGGQQQGQGAADNTTASVMVFAEL